MDPTTPQAIIYTLLTDHAQQLAIASPMWPIQMEDTPLKDPPAGPYLRVDFMPNNTDTPSLSAGNHTIMQGFLQIMLKWPRRQSGVDRGAKRPLEYCGLIEQHFQRGLVFVHAVSGIRVDIYRAPWTSDPLTEGDRSDYPVSIPYRALVNQ